MYAHFQYQNPTYKTPPPPFLSAYVINEWYLSKDRITPYLASSMKVKLMAA